MTVIGKPIWKIPVETLEPVKHDLSDRSLLALMSVQLATSQKYRHSLDEDCVFAAARMLIHVDSYLEKERLVLDQSLKEEKI